MTFKKTLQTACLAGCFIWSSAAYAQLDSKEEPLEIHGNFSTTSQLYNIDTAIGAPIVSEKIRSNTFGNIIVTKGKFSAGARLEAYTPVLLGFDPGYDGMGVPYRYATYSGDRLEFTVGNFYEQFGSGMVLRAYEQPQLGYDNVFDGVRLKFNAGKGLQFKTMIGRQRLFFGKSDGIVRAVDAEWSINDAFEKLAEKKSRITIGGSYVSKYQEDKNSNFTLPENVGAGSGRINFYRGNFSAQAEYAYKANDPSGDNLYLYKPGQGLFFSSSYSKSGMGITLSAKSIDNMSFRSDRDQAINNVLINYLPALTKQHTYNLIATLYPYATQLNGEVAYQADFIYKFKRKTPLGGKYGTTLALNFSTVYGLDSNNLNDLATTRQGYSTNFFVPGQEKFYQDFNATLTKKLSKKWKMKATYVNLIANNNIILVSNYNGVVYSNIGVLDLTYKLKPKHAIRAELQGLFSKQDQGSWATAIIEYTFSPHWFVAVMDQYNYGNPNGKKLHYPLITAGYNANGSRISLTYGRQRAGIFCVGGVCRVVPASNGLTLTATTTF